VATPAIDCQAGERFFWRLNITVSFGEAQTSGEGALRHFRCADSAVAVPRAGFGVNRPMTRMMMV